MFRIKRHVFAATFSLFALGTLPVSMPALAQDNDFEDIPGRNAEADGQLTSDEIQAYAQLAARHIQKLTKIARDEIGSELEQSGVVIPAAWMMLNDGEVKRVRLDESADRAAATVKVLMYKGALKSLARHGKILATAIVYAGTIEEGESTRALAVEYEHRLGLAGLQVVPYIFEQGTLSLGNSSAQKKPYELFYDNPVTNRGE